MTVLGSAELDPDAHGSGEQRSGVDFRSIMSCDRNMGGRKKFYHDMDEIESHATVQAWLSGIKQGPSRTAARYNFARFIRWRRSEKLPSNPDDIIESCLNGNNRTLRDHALILRGYCEGDAFDPANTLETREKHHRTINSFYSQNLVPLPRTRIRPGNSAIRSPVSGRVTATQFAEMTKRVLSTGGLSARDRSIILVVTQSGMDDSTLAEVFNYVAYPQLVKHFGTSDWKKWDLRLCPVRIDLYRPKSDYRYYTFLDIDAVQEVIDWLNSRLAQTGAPIGTAPQQNPNALATSEPIYISKWGRPLRPYSVSLVFREAGKVSGVNVEPQSKPEPFKGAGRRYPFHSHEARDTFITLARRANADIVAANFFLGHSIDRLGYDQSPWDNPDHYRNEYLKIVRPSLNPISGSVISVKKEYDERLRKGANKDAKLKREVSELRALYEELKKEFFLHG